MTPETVDIVTSIIEQVADMLAPGAQAVWAIAMRQVQVQAIASCTTFVLSLLATCLVVIVAKRVARYAEDSTDMWMVCFFSGLLILIPASIAVSSFLGAISRFMNPAYYAIQLLLTTAGVK